MATADLMARGYVRVILTTNFDSLIEQALESEGLSPTVISSADAAEGAPPLAHSQHLVIKLHGDYRDTRIKNTADELESYDERVDALLDRVLDEFGLLICGWSGDWDIALRAALERSRSRRYTTFWTARGGRLREDATRLAELRRAEVISIEGADVFFPELAEKLHSLDELDAPHPLSVRMTVQTAKRYLADPVHRIQLHDLARDVTDELMGQLTDTLFPVHDRGVIEPQGLRNRVRRYEAASETALALIAAGCRWGSDAHVDNWVSMIERVANYETDQSGITTLLALRHYPALLLLYAGGIACIAGSEYGTFNALCRRPMVRGLNESYPAATQLAAMSVFNRDLARLLPGLERRHTPASDWLFDVVREPLKECLPDEGRYEEAFDRLEYLISLQYLDLTDLAGRSSGWAPIGQYTWRRRDDEATEWKRARNELAEDGDAWPPLQQGMFGGSRERLEAAMDRLDSFIASPGIQQIRW